MESENFGDWNASLYMRYARERTQPSRDLAARIDCRHVVCPKILDIGCGSGNSSRILKERFPSAKITGIDSSEGMIESARRQSPDIEFRKCATTPECPEISEEYDVIFSNACLQWVPKHDILFPSLFNKLARGGALAVQIPPTEEMPISKILEGMKASPRWRDAFINIHDLKALPMAQYYDIISSLTENFDIWKTDYVHPLDGVDALLGWYSGSRLRPYFAALPESRRVQFADCVGKGLTEYYPARNNAK